MATAIKMPLLGMTMEEGIISKWLVSDGDSVTQGQVIAEFETDKINAEIEAPADGIIGGITAKEGEAVVVQGIVAYILEPGEDAPAPSDGAGEAAVEPASPAATPPPKPVSQVAATPVPQASASVTKPVTPTGAGLPQAPAAPTDGRIMASPLARKLARELGLDVAAIRGTGPGGRIVANDVRAGADVTIPEPAVAQVAAATVPFRGIRKTIADRMMQSLSAMAQLTLVSEADATEFVDLRTKLAAQHEAALGYRISFNDLLARIVTRALVEHPNMNATLQGENIVRQANVNIGLAVEIANGLAVPNVKNAQNMQLIELSTALHGLTENAAGGGLALDDLSGGTFTITNLGALEIDAFTPVINPPECAILGVGRIVAKPAVVNGEVAVRQMITLSLTFDHRLNDGAPAARFLQRIKQLVEQPYLLI